MSNEMAAISTRPGARAAEALDGQEDVSLHIEPAKIDPHNVVQDFIGLNSRKLTIRLPEGVLVKDLNENTELFRNVQQSRGVSLRKFDEVLLIAWDESWCAEAYIAEAGPTSVTLAKPRIIEMPVRNEKLLNDGTYRLSWVGTGYAVIRIKDGSRVAGPFANKTLAERALLGMYATSS